MLTEDKNSCIRDKEIYYSYYKKHQESQDIVSFSLPWTSLGDTVQMNGQVAWVCTTARNTEKQSLLQQAVSKPPLYIRKILLHPSKLLIKNRAVRNGLVKRGHDHIFFTFHARQGGPEGESSNTDTHQMGNSNFTNTTPESGLLTTINKSCSKTLSLFP